MFNKSIEVKYYNTLTLFELQVMSSNGIADVLMDDVSVKNLMVPCPHCSPYGKFKRLKTFSYFLNMIEKQLN